MYVCMYTCVFKQELDDEERNIVGNSQLTSALSCDMFSNLVHVIDKNALLRYHIF